MTDPRWARVRALFEEALSRRAGPERERWLREATAGDPGLLAEVRTLLDADDDPLPLLDATPGQLAEAVRPEPEEPTVRSRVGPYTVLREIGRGGMATVYLAEREDVGLRVALKLVRGGPAGLAAPEGVSRFLLERRLLARLEHPHIARLLDSGVAPDGTPWFAMELVDGEPITRFCQRHGLPTPQRIELFRKVCDAVAFAHYSLIVHRDLKPSNVMVTGEPGSSTPKLLDFGIAKLLTTDPLDDATLTRTGARVLTVAYAAPEQLRGDPVTTATDVYSLGLLLHEVLTGRRPFASEEASGEVVTELSSRRSVRTEPGLDIDLRAIVERALEVDTERRYPSAAALGEDLARYSRGQPVRARRPTVAYRARKFVGRHRTAVAAAVLAALSLTGGLGVAVWQAKEARRERARTQEALRQSEQVRAFLSDLFDAVHPQPGRESVRSLNELLEQGTRHAERLADQPLVQADVLQEVGQVYYELRGEYPRAEALFRRILGIREGALGADHPSTAETLRWLGDVVLAQGRTEEAEMLYRRALGIQRRHLGATASATLETLDRLGSVSIHEGDLESAYRFFSTALEARRSSLGPDHPAVAPSLRLLASTRRRQGRYEEATELYTEALDVLVRSRGPGSTAAAWAMIHLGDQFFFHNGDTAGARPLYEDGLRILETRLGTHHADLLHGLHSLSSLREAAGDWAEAEALRRRSLDLVRDRYGEHHWRMADELNLLGRYFRRRGRFEEAEPLHRRALTINRAAFDPDHGTVLGTRGELAELFLARGEAERAEALARDLLAIRERRNGKRHVMIALDVERLARTLVPQGRLDEAEALFLRALELYQPHRGDRHTDVQRVLRHLVDLYERQGRDEQAEIYELRLTSARRSASQVTSTTSRTATSSRRSNSSRSGSDVDSDDDASPSSARSKTIRTSRTPGSSGSVSNTCIGRSARAPSARTV